MKRKRKTISASKFKHFLLTAGVRTIERMKGPMAKAGLIQVMPFIFCPQIETSGYGHGINLTITIMEFEEPVGGVSNEQSYTLSFNAKATHVLADTTYDLVEHEAKRMLEAGIPPEQIHDLLMDYWAKDDPVSFAMYCYVDTLDIFLDGREVLIGRKVWREMQKEYNEHLDGKWEDIIMYFLALTTQDDQQLSYAAWKRTNQELSPQADQKGSMAEQQVGDAASCQEETCQELSSQCKGLHV